MKRKMLTRVVLGSIMICAVVALLYLDWWLEQWLGDSAAIKQSRAWAVLFMLPTMLVLVALVLAGFVEFSRLCKGVGVRTLGVSGILSVAALGAYPYWAALAGNFFNKTGRYGPHSLLMPFILVLAIAVMLIFAEQMIRHRTRDAIRQIAATVLGVLYLGVGAALILYLRRDSIAMLLLFLATVKFTDIGAYFTGSLMGRHKMIPWLSPGKSWEGLIGGLVAAAGVSVGLVAVFGGRHELWIAALFGVVVGLAGQFGDLCESLLKRSADLKDSGALVPEFGGVLDMLDSPLMAAPAAVIFLGILRML